MKVLLIDDHPLIREIVSGVARAAFPGCEVATANDLSSTLAMASNRTLPDLIILDLGLPDSAATETLDRVQRRYPDVRVVVISADRSRETVRNALRAGAVGYIPKSLNTNVMVSALKLIASGGIYVPMEAVMDEPPGHGSGAGNGRSLTKRQKEILKLIARGHGNRSIAARLAISEGTVKQHVHALFNALGVSSRAQAVGMAFRLRIADE